MQLMKQLIKFGLVGVTATLIDTIVYAILTHYGFYYQFANVAGFVLSLVFNYVASMKFVFQSKYTKAERYKEQLIFVGLSGAGFLWSVVLLKLLIDGLHWQSMASKISVTIVVIMWNFITRKLFLEQK